MMTCRRPEIPLSLEELRELLDIDLRGNMGALSKGTWGDYARFRELERQEAIRRIRDKGQDRRSQIATLRRELDRKVGL